MPETFIAPFRYAYHGYQIHEFKPGDVIERDDPAFESALEEGRIALPKDAVWPPVPRLWPGETVCCIASGPSLVQADVDYLRGKCRVVVTNSSWRMAPWADLLYACDGDWWKHYNGVPEFAGLKVTTDPAAAARWGLKCVPLAAKHEGDRQVNNIPGVTTDPMFLHSGGNSGYQMFNLAGHLIGWAGRILLLAYDLKQGADGRLHWFGDHPQPLRNGKNYPLWRKRFATIPASLPAGVEVLNCTRDTALDCFRCARLEEVLP